MSAPLETHDVSVRFGALEAVSEVSVSVEPKTILGLIGPNGAGKTTFVNTVTGFAQASSGTVMIDGRDMTGSKPWHIARAGVARTFQIVKPFRSMTVRENVALGSMFSGQDSRSLASSLGRADDVLERVGLADKAEALPGEVPVADNKRLELAKALAMGPRVLLLDEVMAGLRPAEIDRSIKLIGSLRDDGLTIVVIEHVMKAVIALCDHVFVLHEGRRLTEGPPDEVATDERVIEAYLGERYAQRAREERNARGQ